MHPPPVLVHRLVLNGTELERPLLERSRGRNGDVLGGTLLAERLQPRTVVKFGVVLLDLAIAVDDHVVDAVDRERARSGAESPSPGDAAAVVPHVEGRHAHFGLEDTLTIVKEFLGRESDRAKLITRLEMHGQGNLGTGKLTGKPAMKLIESEMSLKSSARVALEISWG